MTGNNCTSAQLTSPRGHHLSCVQVRRRRGSGSWAGPVASARRSVYGSPANRQCRPFQLQFMAAAPIVRVTSGAPPTPYPPLPPVRLSRPTHPRVRPRLRTALALPRPRPLAGCLLHPRQNGAVFT